MIAIYCTSCIGIHQYMVMGKTYGVARDRMIAELAVGGVLRHWDIEDLFIINVDSDEMFELQDQFMIDVKEEKEKRFGIETMAQAGIGTS